MKLLGKGILFFLLYLSSVVTSFLHHCPPNRHTKGACAYSNYCRKYKTTIHRRTIFSAIVYGEDGQIEKNEEAESSSVPSSSLNAELVTALTSRLDRQALIRIACAFAPPPHNNLHPSNTADARLASISPLGAEIAVSVIAGDDSASVVQILIPIDFPTKCYGESEDCFVENFETLDVQASLQIADSERKEDMLFETDAQQRLLQSLKEEPPVIDLPNWWTFVGLNRGLEQECSSLKNLLNEDDFAEDINALFLSRYADTKKDLSMIRLIKASIALVGPSGVSMKAYLERQGDIKNESERYVLADLSIQFEKEASSSDMLRSSILDLVENAGRKKSDDISAGDDTLSVPVEENTKDDFDIIRQQYLFQRSLLEARLEIEGRENRSRSTNKPNRNLKSSSSKRIETGIDDTPIGVDQKPDDLARKYAQIEDIGERAFAILRDLNLV